MELINFFSGKIKNVVPNFLFDEWNNNNFNFLKIVENSRFNGSYNIKTNKNFVIQSADFISDGSIIFSKNKEENEIFRTKFSGKVSWEKKNNLLGFSE